MKKNVSKVRNLEGFYTKQGSRLIGTDFDLLIQTRQASSRTKAKAGQFMLCISKPLEVRTYVSSLWQTDTPGRYELEQGGVRYVLELSAPRPHIFTKQAETK